MTCLSAQGFIANRGFLLSKYDLSEAMPDTRLLEKLFGEFGENSGSQVYGDCSWILWDGHRQEIIAFADRLGLNPIFYGTSGPLAALSAAIRPLCAKLGRAASPRIESIVRFLHHLPPEQGETFLSGVHTVPPGHLLKIHRHHLEWHSYWDFSAVSPLTLNTDESLAERLFDLLQEIVTEYLAGPPCAVTLSGGLDTAAVTTATRSVQAGSGVMAIAWKADAVPEIDESQWARSLAEYLNVPVISLNIDDCWPMKPPGIETWIESPVSILFAGIWNKTFAAAAAAQRRLTFSGAGGDHLFSDHTFGYPDFFLTGRWNFLIPQIRKGVPFSGDGWIRFLWKRLGKPIGRTVRQRFIDVRQPEPWLAPQHLRHFKDYCETDRRHSTFLPGRLDRLTRFNIPQMALILGHVNKIAAKACVEMRHPLLDHRMVEFAFALPPEQIVRDGKNKFILKNSLKGRLPDEILSTRQKPSLAPLVRQGLIVREREAVTRMMRGMKAAELGFINEAELRGCFEKFVNGTHKNLSFWNALCLEDWLRRHFS